MACLALTAPVGAFAAGGSHTQSIDAGASLNAVSCVPATTDCVVSDSKGNALYSTDVSASAEATWKSWSGPESPSEAIACPSSSLCVLADGVAEEPGPGGNMYYASSLGGSWTEAFNPAFGVVAVSCASTTLCVSGEEGDGAIRYTSKPASGEWFALDEIGGVFGAMKGVDCLSSSFCSVVDSKGNVHIANTEAKIKETSGWKSTDIDGSTALHGVACAARASCIAVDETGDVLDIGINSGGEATASKDDIDGTNNLTAITCTGFTCATVDKQGNVFVSGNGGVSWTKELATGTDLTSVSCASSALCVTTDTTGNVTAFTAPSSDYALTVFVTGEGKVESSPAGIACEAEECLSHEFEGAVTLMATPKPGYVLAGWLGCKHTGSDTCEITTPTSEVTAVFLKQGTEGSEGKVGKEGSAGKEGTPGAAGPAGVAGSAGAQGSAGPPGAKGPAGPAGKEGPAGKVELVTCKKVGGRQRCATKLLSGTVKFTTASARATLSRHGIVYAAGTARRRRGRMSLRLIAVRSLRPGRYTLTLTSGSGAHRTTRSEPFTLS
jgi:hypothetical protein